MTEATYGTAPINNNNLNFVDVAKKINNNTIVVAKDNKNNSGSGTAEEAAHMLMEIGLRPAELCWLYANTYGHHRVTQCIEAGRKDAKRSLASFVRRALEQEWVHDLELPHQWWARRRAA